MSQNMFSEEFFEGSKTAQIATSIRDSSFTLVILITTVVSWQQCVAAMVFKILLTCLTNTMWKSSFWINESEDNGTQLILNLLTFAILAIYFNN
jgi:hypothetical protein